MECKVNHKTPDEFTTNPIDKMPEKQYEKIVQAVNKPPQFPYTPILVGIIVTLLLFLFTIINRETLDSLSDRIDKNDNTIQAMCAEITTIDNDSVSSEIKIAKRWVRKDIKTVGTRCVQYIYSWSSK